MASPDEVSSWDAAIFARGQLEQAGFSEQTVREIGERLLGIEESAQLTLATAGLSLFMDNLNGSRSDTSSTLVAGPNQVLTLQNYREITRLASKQARTFFSRLIGEQSALPRPFYQRVADTAIEHVIELDKAHFDRRSDHYDFVRMCIAGNDDYDIRKVHRNVTRQALATRRQVMRNQLAKKGYAAEYWQKYLADTATSYDQVYHLDNLEQ